MESCAHCDATGAQALTQHFAIHALHLKGEHSRLSGRIIGRKADDAGDVCQAVGQLTDELLLMFPDVIYAVPTDKANPFQQARCAGDVMGACF